MKKLTKLDISAVQVSSVARNDKNFGKQNIFDGFEETCWTSNEGTPQWISVELKEPHQIAAFSIQFQGGFAGQNSRVEFTNEKNEISSEPFFPEDVNSIQQFPVSKVIFCKRIKFVFEGSTDFFGRIVVYSIDLYSE